MTDSNQRPTLLIGEFLLVTAANGGVLVRGKCRVFTRRAWAFALLSDIVPLGAIGSALRKQVLRWLPSTVASPPGEETTREEEDEIDTVSVSREDRPVS